LLLSDDYKRAKVKVTSQRPAGASIWVSGMICCLNNLLQSVAKLLTASAVLFTTEVIPHLNLFS